MDSKRLIRRPLPSGPSIGVPAVPAPRSQWKGFLKLSLVSCPIALYPAITDAHRVKFRQVNKRTGNRLRHQLVDTVTGEAVERYDKGRGYEIGADQFLPVEEHEIEAARAAAIVAPPPEQERRSEPNPVARRMLPARDMDEVEMEEEMPAPPPPPLRLENDHTIEIERFVPRSQIDPVYFDKAYYIVPREPVGQEAFAVVRNAMSEEGMVALGHVTLSSRRRPIAIEAFGKGLRGFVLRHLHEVRSEADYFSDVADMKLPSDMLAVAKHILKLKTGDFEPSFLEDKYQHALVQMLRKKQAQTSVRSEPVCPSRQNVVSLMDKLKRSIAAEERVAGLKPSPRLPRAKSKRPSAGRRKAG